MEWFNAFIVVFASGMRLAVPLILACLRASSERSGIVDIGLEGKILVARSPRPRLATIHRKRVLGLLAAPRRPSSSPIISATPRSTIAPRISYPHLRSTWWPTD